MSQEPKIGPHGVDLAAPRGSTKYRQNAPFARVSAALQRKVEADRAAARAEAAKRNANTNRASGRGKATQ